MATRDELLALAERCEREEPSLFLDAKIEFLVGEHDRKAFPHPDGWVLGGRGEPVKARPFTKSLEAAMTLVPDGMWLSINTMGKQARAFIGKEGDGFGHNPKHIAVAASLVLALCAAALRALAAMEAP